MAVAGGLVRAKVMHHRHIPKRNRFVYGLYYLCVPLHRWSELRCGILNVDGRGLLSVRAKDHGARDGSSLEAWIRQVLQQFGVHTADGPIELMTLPRVAGYLFNPVSFWFCSDRHGGLRAVLAEVNNTFKEQHSYVISHPDGRVIQPDEWLEAQKVFYVSPFLEVKGKYLFRFNYRNDSVGVWINYFTEEGKVLDTFVGGPRRELNPGSLIRMFLRFPLTTLQVIGLIHYQAFKLWLKGVRYVTRPKPPEDLISR